MIRQLKFKKYNKVQKTLKDFGYCDFETIEKNNTIAYMISEKF